MTQTSYRKELALSTCGKILVTFFSSALLSVPARADVSAILRTFVDVCPPALIQEVSPLRLGMVPQKEGISRVITTELISSMPGVFWRDDATGVIMSLPLGRLTCSVGGEIGEPTSSLAAFDRWRAEHPNLLRLIDTQTFGSTDPNEGVFLELCLVGPSDVSEHLVTGEINRRQNGWSLNLTLYRNKACRSPN